MFTDNILQFGYSNNSMDSLINLSIRKNPFLNRNEDYAGDESFHRGLSQINTDNDLLVSDHFDSPLADCDRRLSIEELTALAKECRQTILSLVDNVELKNKFIERLIELNEALHSAKESRKINTESIYIIQSNSDDRLIDLAGHKFIKCRCGLPPLQYCEVCQSAIKTTRSFYRCNECNIRIHYSWSCMQGLNRSCPASDNGHPSMSQSQIFSRRRFSSLDSRLQIDIDSFPISGDLTSQKFLCAECNKQLKAISSNESGSSPRSPTRFCHYYRKFYCSSCHWNDKHLIPSVYFMLNKWKEMSVCRSAFIKLRYLWSRALFRMPLFWQRNNAAVDSVLIIRRKLFFLRVFISDCPLLKQISKPEPEWLLDQPYLVTMQFVEELCAGSMLQRLQLLYSNVVTHIPQCEKCQHLCNPCHMCSDPVKLNLLSRAVWVCSLCSLTCIHERCALARYSDKSEFVCPACSSRI